MTRSPGRNGRDAIIIVLDAVKDLALKHGGRITDELLLKAQENARREIGGASDYINLRLPVAVRHEMYRRDHKAGMTKHEVARKHNVSVRTIETAVKTPTELFGEDISRAEGENG